MNDSTSPNRVLHGIAGAIFVLASTAAFAGGNGNGGNGSGGSHGAATAGMTYHSEPVTSPWNRPPEALYGQRSDASSIIARRETDPRPPATGTDVPR